MVLARPLRRNGLGRFPFATALLALPLIAACGGAAPPTASPTTLAASPTAAIIPTPARPSLASPVASPSPVAAAASPTAAPKPTAGGETYTVQPGDTLLAIAEKVYNDSTLWRQIYEANKDVIGPNPDALKIDMKLRIPPKQ